MWNVGLRQQNFHDRRDGLAALGLSGWRRCLGFCRDASPRVDGFGAVGQRRTGVSGLLFVPFGSAATILKLHLLDCARVKLATSHGLRRQIVVADQQFRTKPKIV